MSANLRSVPRESNSQKILAVNGCTRSISRVENIGDEQTKRRNGVRQSNDGMEVNAKECSSSVDNGRRFSSRRRFRDTVGVSIAAHVHS